MGTNNYDYNLREAAVMRAASTGQSEFVHDTRIRTRQIAATVNEKLDVRIPNRAGNRIRESRDSAEHPQSLPIVIMFDVTGSMRKVPQIFLTRLGKLMGFLIKKGYVNDPHIMFGAIGDAKYDKVPLQIGQFESGNESDEALFLFYLEGGGGSNSNIPSPDNFHESYELAMYYLARHTITDSFESREKKGYVFFIGDEMPYDKVNPDQVEKLIGDNLKAPIKTEDILEELQDRYEVFWITPGGTSYCSRKEIIEHNKSLFGQNYITLDNPKDVMEVIATAIAINEGHDLDGVTDDLKDISSDKDSVNRAKNALVPYVQNRGLATRGKGKVEGKLAVAGSDSVARLKD